MKKTKGIKISLSLFTAKRLERMGKSPEAAISDYLKNVEAQEAKLRKGRALKAEENKTL